ncbi:hypothetical protein ACVILH_002148 [Bradyrhizobium sp. USDA 4353]
MRFTQAAPLELAQERLPEHLGFGRTNFHAENPAPAVAPAAMITATETMRPFWRTFTYVAPINKYGQAPPPYAA